MAEVELRDFRWERCSTHAIRNCTACWSVEKYGPMVPLPLSLTMYPTSSKAISSVEGVANVLKEHTLVSAAKVYADAEAKLNAARDRRRRAIEETQAAEKEVASCTESLDKAKEVLVATLKI